MPQVMYRREIDELKAFNRDIAWFQANYEKLKESYKAEYVAIQNRKVIGHAKYARALVRSLRSKRYDPSKLVVEYINPTHKVFVL